MIVLKANKSYILAYSSRSMAARCSLDDFIRNNTYSVKVGYFSQPVHFPKLDYLVPPGALFDLTVLYGLGYQLESRNVRAGTDISKGLGTGSLLDRKGKDTGYCLSSSGHGLTSPDGSWSDEWHTEYFINDKGSFRGVEARDFESRFRRMKLVQERERKLRLTLPEQRQ